jgi:hypothetical protein
VIQRDSIAEINCATALVSMLNNEENPRRIDGNRGVSSINSSHERLTPNPGKEKFETVIDPVDTDKENRIVPLLGELVKEYERLNAIAKPELAASKHTVSECPNSTTPSQPSQILSAEEHLGGSVLADSDPILGSADSGFGDSDVDSTCTLPSAYMDHVIENGRTYHAFKAGKYPLPNDKQESDRLGLQHYLFALTFHHKLLTCPVEMKRVHRVLDVGTGTGAWAIAFARQHPECHVIGVDLSPVQPSWVPPNAEFMIDDVDVDGEVSKSLPLIYKYFR